MALSVELEPVRGWFERGLQQQVVLPGAPMAGVQLRFELKSVSMRASVPPKRMAPIPANSAAFARQS
jgi:hypothetical protein